MSGVSVAYGTNTFNRTFEELKLTFRASSSSGAAAFNRIFEELKYSKIAQV